MIDGLIGGKLHGKPARAKKLKAPETATPRAKGVLTLDERFLRISDENLDKDALCDRISARALSQPEVRAASIIQKFEGDTDINVFVDEIHEQVDEVHKGDMRRPEAMLVAQAHTLDALFCNLARRAHSNLSSGYLDAAERYLRLALKSQAQAVRTIEALGELKNPRSVAFVQQANIANGPQQVNNGVQAGESPAHGNHSIPSNELSGKNHELLPDTGASQAASRMDTPMETVGAIDRAAN